MSSPVLNAVRKDSAVSSSSSSSSSGPRAGGPRPRRLFWDRHEFWTHYDLENGKRELITIRHLCNQLIHSFVWIISGNEDSELFDGAFVASEKERVKHLYFLPVQSLIDLCRKAAAEDIGSGSTQYQRGEDRVMRIVSVKAMENDWD